MTVVRIDPAGRIVIPEEIRKAHRLRPGTSLLLVEMPDGRLWLQRLDAKELAKRIREELKGTDVRPLLADIEAEIEQIAVRRYRSKMRRRP